MSTTTNNLPLTIAESCEGHLMQCSAFRDDSGRFSPLFVVFRRGVVVHCQEHHSGGARFALEEEAVQFALASARRWITENQADVSYSITVYYGKRRFEEMLAPLAEQGPFSSIEDARRAPFPEGYSEAHFYVGRQKHVYCRRGGWQVRPAQD